MERNTVGLLFTLKTYSWNTTIFLKMLFKPKTVDSHKLCFLYKQEGFCKLQVQALKEEDHRCYAITIEGHLG